MDNIDTANGVSDICPSTYAYQKFGISHTSLNTEKPFHWSDSTIANMLENELYLGNTVT